MLFNIPRAHTLWNKAKRHLNFFRIHTVFFTVVPVIFSGIFYASNGRYHVAYIDALFNCVSAMAVCGLATIDLSSLTPWQQAMLFIQMCLGSPVLVSWVIVYTRRHYFGKKFENMIRAEMAQRLENGDPHATVPLRGRVAGLFKRGTALPTVRENSEESDSNASGNAPKLTPGMIRRVDGAPKLVNPSGWISEGREPGGSAIQGSAYPEVFPPSPLPINAPLGTIEEPDADDQGPTKRVTRPRGSSDPGAPPRVSLNNTGIQRYETMEPTSPVLGFRPPGRTPTVEFAASTARPSGATNPHHGDVGQSRRRRPSLSLNSDVPRAPTRNSGSRRSLSISHVATGTGSELAAMDSGFGGFPMPFRLLYSALRRLFPNIDEKLSRTLTIPLTTTIMSQVGSGVLAAAGAKTVPYVSFHAIVGRNSAFRALTTEQMEELGGVEYRALNALLWILPVYHFGIQLTAFAVIAPYISLPKWRDLLVPPTQYRPVNTVWFSAFQCVSAYTNSGTSLVDQSMIPFQTAYPMIILLIFLIYAGNTAFPIFLRFMIWIITKLLPVQSRACETLHFLLDHPRRCFIYLFPSHQTWFLLTILVLMTFTDWFLFLILDIGNATIEAIPLGTRVLAGLFQGVAVRSGGFAIVPPAALAPAVKVLYVVMMYVSVYPIAMSVRSTNVYEERSLGIFDHDDPVDEDQFRPTGTRISIWSRYLTMHARRQLAFDMWWLALALFLICVIERRSLIDPAKYEWFNIFNILFELTSAYGTVGLSLGSPTANYSFSGSLRPLSKFIICLVMLRGRHRGLPVAIDRAVMLPFEFASSRRGTDSDEDNGNNVRDDEKAEEEQHIAQSQGQHGKATDIAPPMGN